MNTARLPRVSFAKSQPHLFPWKTDGTQRGITGTILSTCLCHNTNADFCLVAVLCPILNLLMEKEMATHTSVLAWRIPGTGEPGGLQSMGLHRVGHDWSDLAAAAEPSHPRIIHHELRKWPRHRDRKWPLSQCPCHSGTTVCWRVQRHKADLCSPDCHLEPGGEQTLCLTYCGHTHTHKLIMLKSK